MKSHAWGDNHDQARCPTLSVAKQEASTNSVLRCFCQRTRGTVLATFPQIPSRQDTCGAFRRGSSILIALVALIVATPQAQAQWKARSDSSAGQRTLSQPATTTTSSNGSQRPQRLPIPLMAAPRRQTAHPAVVRVQANDSHGSSLGSGTLVDVRDCLLYTSPSPRDGLLSRMPSSA